MTPSNAQGSSRRSFMKQAGAVSAASALAGVYVPPVHAGEQNTIKVALVGCGGRGTGAAANALSVENGPIKLVAMADVFQDKMDGSVTYLEEKFSSQMDVPEERRFIGFDGYREAIDCLDPGDVVIFTTPPAFRWPMFQYAIEKGINTFMEKPVTVDGPTTRRMIELGERAKEKNLKVGVGLMCRHCDARKELHQRIKDGEIGDLHTLRSYRQVGGGGLIGPNDGDMSELLYQIRNFHGFMWASGGVIMDYMIHNIDESCWMKDAWPVTAQAQGARLYRGDKVDQNFDNYSIEYTFDDGTKLFVYTRNVPRCHQEFASYAHGTKGSAVISTSSHTPAKCRIYPDQRIDQGEPTWAFPQPEPNPYQLEWDHLISAIRNDEPWNEVRRGAEASLVTAMGRMAAHTGRVVTFDEMLNHEHEFAPEVDSFTMDSPAPLQLLASGIYPQPEPGRLRDREF
ncbi:Gfo/Idh/MocA family oxidoreductase [Tautonia plasticadhaerens]|uniref:Inositol 2-dehydrogenase/D-chiro-inositol 3-dehydrogenase n=1 Tax=Tautonia plasticadhaerens TaxID=2527974 RepID=A0A518H2J2_9BACT|nr:Gfo/Idh/MocA family oxidoreductase [Tautonia plasticadhaerens]QDV35033.1 Inositol 2-dehydrogenase/D-chiro-inositol 3-dehydrogenase [Tautonia plasticadhaerens]